MSKTRSKKILELFYELGEKMDVKIVNAKGEFQGGYCQVNDTRHIVINKIKPLDQQLNILADGFMKLNIKAALLNSLYIKNLNILLNREKITVDKIMSNLDKDLKKVFELPLLFKN